MIVSHIRHVPAGRTTEFEDDCSAPVSLLARSSVAHPSVFSLEITPACNNSCAGCSNVFIRDTPTRHLTSSQVVLPYEQWHRILDVIQPYAQAIKITGGEATLHPRFHDIVREIDARRIPFTVFTNGRWSLSVKVVSMLSGLEYCAGLLVSLHGATAYSHEAFTAAPHSFEEAIASIRLAAKSGLPVRTNTVLTLYNYQEIRQIAELATKLGADCAVFNRFVGRPISGLTLPPQLLRQALMELTRLRDQDYHVKLSTCVPGCVTTSFENHCSAGTAYCTIDPWGNVRPCNHAPLIVGNILNGSITDIWKSSPIVIWRELLAGNCGDCGQSAQTCGGCRADALLNGLTYDPLVSRSDALIPPRSHLPCDSARVRCAVLL